MTEQQWGNASPGVRVFCEHIMAMGFTVYIAENRQYGFITDDTESRVLSWSFAGLTDSLSGNYGPPSTTSGTGWRMDQTPGYLATPERVRECLYAHPPSWVRGGGWRYLSTVKQYLNEYGSSSRFVKLER